MPELRGGYSTGLDVLQSLRRTPSWILSRHCDDNVSEVRRPDRTWCAGLCALR